MMAAETMMEQLPLDVLEHLVSYISDKDLARCCAVSKKWHEVFTNDMFWEKQCNTKLSVFLENAKCLVEPYFTIPNFPNSSLTDISGWRLCFLREQHYLKNLRSGRYKSKEIEFDYDDTISYDIEVECVAKDYVFLHTTFETQVWNVTEEPNLEMTIPFKLVELWEDNLYKFHDNNLIVVQCNVVQLFNLDLNSKSWLFHRAFFFDKPEEFSLNITKDTDVNEMFKNTSYEEDSVSRILCGKFFIGIVITKAALQNPVLHIWDLNLCKKIKEENCSEFFGSDVTSLYLEESSESQDMITVTFRKHQHKKSQMIGVYSLAKLKFLVSYVGCRICEANLYDGYLWVCDILKNEMLRVDLDTNVAQTVYNFDHKRLECWGNMRRKVVLALANEIVMINPLDNSIEIQAVRDFQLGSFDIVKDKYLALRNRQGNLRELCEYKDKLAINNQNVFEQMFQLSMDFIYRAENEVCTKMVLEQANKLIILNFW